MTISRRAFLGGFAATAACAGSGGGDGAGDPSSSSTGGRASTTTSPPPRRPIDLPADIAAVELPADPFTLGVASGDPDHTSVLLWTRLAPEPLATGGGMPTDVPAIVLDVGIDDSFAEVVHSAPVVVDTARGHAVHAVIDGLEPATTYAYRFRVGAYTSPTGRTRTTPGPDVEAPVRLAVASCQRYVDGYWAAHRDMAAADVDLVVFLGDYIYEQESAEGVRRRPDGGGDEARDLDGYRHRYVTARLDPDLAANHAAHPWAVIWDDHEVRNDHAGGAPLVPVERIAAAYQAWWEHMPVRMPAPDGAALAIHRSLRIGSLVDLVLLDTRQHRSAEACGGGVVGVDCAELGDSARTMLGAAQEAWAVETISGSTATWTVLAQSVVLSEVELLGVVNADAWDGYGPARSQLVAALDATANPVVLTGDIHVQLVGDVTDAAGVVVAAELVTPSVSSRPRDAYAEAVGLLPVVAPNVRHAADVRGWLRCEIDAQRCRATYREVVEIDDPASAVVDGPSFDVRAGIRGTRPA